MKKQVNTTLVSILVFAALLVGITTSQVAYDPWADYNDDGYVGIDDIVSVAERFGGLGDSIVKAYVAYDSEWEDITNKIGQIFSLTHNVNSTDVIIDVIGKQNLTYGGHKLFFGTTNLIQGVNQTYGGANSDYAQSVVQSVDGGYAIVGTTESFGAGSGDFMLVKTDANGIEQWNQTYGGIGYERAYSVVLTQDGGYAIAGYTNSFGAGNWDFWLVKTNAVGNIVWNRTYGGSNEDLAQSAVATADGGYIMAGYTTGVGVYDAWLVKTDSSGNMQWNQTYGGSNFDFAYSVMETADGGYAIAGRTESFGVGGGDFWLVKTDASGNMEWNRTFGGVTVDEAQSVIETIDGGYVLAGWTFSFPPRNFWLVKTDANGNHVWNRTYGGSNVEYGQSVVQTEDGGYAMVGYTASFGAGNDDFWLVKIDANGNHEWNKTYGGPSHDRAYAIVETADGGYAIAGGTGSFGAGVDDFWLIKTDVEEGFSIGLSMTMLTDSTITFYRGSADPYWNFIRVRIWKIKDSP